MSHKKSHKKATHKAPGFSDSGFKLPELEERVLDFWEADRTFKKSVKNRAPKKSGKVKEFIFYEGPPTANGRPGIHHVLARAFKDIVPRYKTMQGYHVPRRAGWDTHGLPVELEVEKKLNLSSKKDIEKFGIAKFNQASKDSVWKYLDEWKQFTKRIGFWIDMDSAYVTYKNKYMETLWWIISQFEERGLLYQGHKVVPWCSRCGTALSSHELAQGYKEVKDNSVYVKFRLKPGQDLGGGKTGKNTFVLSWTTTPWTLPGNVALAVGKNVKYAVVSPRGSKEEYIIAEDLIPEVLDELNSSPYRVVKGKALLGMEYEPLFSVKGLSNENTYKIYSADFVTTEDGTGVVHTAVMYGEDDYKLGEEAGLPKEHTVREDGMFKKNVPALAGMYAKSKKAEDAIFSHLKDGGNLLKTAQYAHEYPHCWRCDTPLLYYARASWFVAMSSLREKLTQSNKKINWIPEHVKEGRFGEWLKDAKDWNFSRERYWGTPLPIWTCKECGERKVVEGIEDLAENATHSNTFLFFRHTESEHNVNGIFAGGPETKGRISRLTKKGTKEADKLAGRFSPGSIDAIYTSPYFRTKELAQKLSAETGAKVIEDPRLGETNVGEFNWCPISERWKFFSTSIERFTKTPEGGENLSDVRSRAVTAITEINRKHKDKNIAIVSHGEPLWLMVGTLKGLDDEGLERFDHFDTGEMRKVRVRDLPRNNSGEMDLHRPYIDEVILECVSCKGEMRRVPEVADVWFDSGAMPLAQGHYPFSCKKGRPLKPSNCVPYPADFISEAMDQTRGWFYTLLATATALGLKAPYKNVISLGLIHDKHGQKMSKSKGNTVNPWEMMDKYGIDAVRWYFYTVNPPGEPTNFDEIEVGKGFRKFHMILYNSFVFWRTYGKGLLPGAKAPVASGLLDKWILARLKETINRATRSLDQYDIREAALAIEKLTDDLSRWYIRRSRRRLQKPETKKEHAEASKTLAYALIEIAKLMAPFSPFFAEGLWQSLAKPGSTSHKKSVHLADWSSAPKLSVSEKKLISAMEEAREISSLALAERARAGIKVRQPLSRLKVKKAHASIKGNKGLEEIIKEEINVKEISFGSKISEAVELDTEITQELKEEGMARDVIRAVQGLRQKAGLTPRDKINLSLEVSDDIENVLRQWEAQIKKDVGAKRIGYSLIGKSLASGKLELEEEGIDISIHKA